MNYTAIYVKTIDGSMVKVDDLPVDQFEQFLDDTDKLAEAYYYFKDWWKKDETDL